MTLTTPAVLFPAISLLLLAYTNRFLTLATVIRNLHRQYQEDPDHKIFYQIRNLRRRAYLIRNMQVFGVTSLFFCVFCMFLLFAKQELIAQYLFGFSLVLLMISLALSVWEVQISMKAINIHLSNLEKRPKKKN